MDNSGFGILLPPIVLLDESSFLSKIDTSRGKVPRHMLRGILKLYVALNCYRGVKMWL